MAIFVIFVVCLYVSENKYDDDDDDAARGAGRAISSPSRVLGGVPTAKRNFGIFGARERHLPGGKVLVSFSTHSLF